jgi:hypothetical protein
LTAKCGGFKRTGEPCTVTVEPPQLYCWWHDPSYSEERKRAASKGGKAKASPLTRELHRQLETLAEDVANGDLAPYRAAVIVQALNARIRLLETERRIAEQEDLLARLEELERIRSGSRSSWAG